MAVIDLVMNFGLETTVVNQQPSSDLDALTMSWKADIEYEYIHP